MGVVKPAAQVRVIGTSLTIIFFLVFFKNFLNTTKTTDAYGKQQAAVAKTDTLA